MNENDPFDLNRFLTAQEGEYPAAFQELRSGKKSGHWMWYVFPQFKGLAPSQTSQFYGISSMDEASEYLKHRVLGSRLVSCTEAVLGLPTSDAKEIFGSVDSLKFCSCMTLFELVAEEKNPFSLALDKFFGGVRDKRTLELCSPR